MCIWSQRYLELSCVIGMGDVYGSCVYLCVCANSALCGSLCIVCMFVCVCVCVCYVQFCDVMSCDVMLCYGLMHTAYVQVLGGSVIRFHGCESIYGSEQFFALV